MVKGVVVKGWEGLCGEGDVVKGGVVKGGW